MRPETANILALIDTYTLPSADDTSMKMAEDFRNRRIEKGITREEIAKMAGIATSNVARFEQKGLISLKNMIGLASALGYLGELKNLFAEAKFSTMEELLTIRKNQGKKRACSATNKPKTHHND